MEPSSWDTNGIPAVQTWQAILRVLKPGAHILVACGTRTQHRMAASIEDAGFEIRDVVCWHYGQGFPKSLDISKAIDKQAAAERRIIGVDQCPAKRIPNGRNTPETGDWNYGMDNRGGNEFKITEPATEFAKKWDGWGTALKPATEFWTLARKPISEETIAQNIVKYGTGALNIDISRIRYEQAGSLATNPSLRTHINGGNGGNIIAHEKMRRAVIPNSTGRFPANLILDESAAKQMDEQSGILKSGKPVGKRKAQNKIYGQYAPGKDITGFGDSGGASRFFYVAKASPKERGAGNTHSTVKPLALMKYLIQLVCPLQSGRILLDPFAGSGTTCIAAKSLGLDFVAFELDADYAKMAENRLLKNLNNL
jgi:DNA modification methylase